MKLEGREEEGEKPREHVDLEAEQKTRRPDYNTQTNTIRIVFKVPFFFWGGADLLFVSKTLFFTVAYAVAHFRLFMQILVEFFS